MPKIVSPLNDSEKCVVPELTSAEALGRYIPGLLKRESAGPVWRDLRARIIEQSDDVDQFAVPAVVELFLVRVSSGRALIKERVPGGDWEETVADKGALFLTAPGASYELTLQLKGAGPFVTFQVLIGLPLMARASEEVFGEGGVAQLRSLSGFDDDFVSVILDRLEAELKDPGEPSGLLVQGLAQALAVHLMRTYALAVDRRLKTGGLAGSVLKRITDAMSRELDRPFSLGRWSALAAMSAAHFSRCFKQSTGLSPMQYFLSLKMARARRLLRETRASVLQVGLDVGYSSPSHFAQVFRRETGVSPADYRKQG